MILGEVALYYNRLPEYEIVTGLTEISCKFFPVKKITVKNDIFGTLFFPGKMEGRQGNLKFYSHKPYENDGKRGDDIDDILGHPGLKQKYESKAANYACSCVDLLSKDYRDLITQNVSYDPAKGAGHRSQSYGDDWVEAILDSNFYTGYRKDTQTYGIKKEKRFL